MMAMSGTMKSRGGRIAMWAGVSALIFLCAGWFHTRTTALQLTGAYLERMQAPGARLMQVDFERAILRCSNLAYARLDGCNLNHADLSQANLGSASLRRVTLVGANLQAANLGAGSLRGADLTNARLEGANLQAADLRDACLAGATWDRSTTLPDGCDPSALGMHFMDTE